MAMSLLTCSNISTLKREVLLLDRSDACFSLFRQGLRITVVGSFMWQWQQNVLCYFKQNQRFNCRDTFILTEWHHKYYAIMALTDKMQKAEKRSSAWITSMSWLHQQWWSSEGKSNKRSVTSDFSQQRQQIATINRHPLAADVENNIKHIWEQVNNSVNVIMIDIDQGGSLRRSSSPVITMKPGKELGIAKRFRLQDLSWDVDDWMSQTIFLLPTLLILS